MINPGGSGENNLTNTAAKDEEFPDYSPDGREILYVRAGDLFTMRADGSHVDRITNSDADEDDPAWGPNGRKIVFASPEAGDDEIYRSDVDGSHRRRLTNNSADDDEPNWSSDGQIAWESSRTGEDDIWIMNAQGGEAGGVQNLTGGIGVGHDEAPSFSPNGNLVAFDRGEDVFSVSKTGLNPQNLTDEVGSVQTCFEPAWSPDGRQIAFAGYFDADDEIWRMDKDGSDVRQVTDDTETNEEDPAWQPK